MTYWRENLAIAAVGIIGVVIPIVGVVMAIGGFAAMLIVALLFAASQMTAK